jgi:hypothetical protein
MRESGKESLDALGLEGGWRCLMDEGRLDTGVAKGSLSKELGVVGLVAVVWTNGTTLSRVWKRRNAVVGGLPGDVKDFISVAGHNKKKERGTSI